MGTVAKLTIMIVDDEPELARVLADQFEIEGHVAICCHSVAEAVDQLSRASVDYIVSDIRMPKECGLTLLDHTKAPIIFMSGFSDFAANEVQERGGIAMLVKPFEFKNLLNAVLSHKKAA